MKTSHLFMSGALLPTLLPLGGCLHEGGGQERPVDASVPVFAIMYDDLLQGTAAGQLQPSGAIDATVHIRSTTPGGLACSGELRYPQRAAGVVNLTCSDGISTRIPFTAL